MEKVARIPPAWAKSNRAAAKALLAVEASALRALRLHTNAATQRLALMVSQSRLQNAETARIIGIHHAQQEAAGITQNLGRSLCDARADARAAAVASLDRELALVEDALDVALKRPGLSTEAGTIDAESAMTTANSFAAAWLLATTAVIKSTDAPSSGAAVRRAVADIQWRLRRIAATEVPQAYSDEHDKGTGWIASHYENERWIVGLFKRWEGMLDRRICPVCERHDGEIVLVGTSYDGDDVPGFVHANCRCIDTILFLPARVRDEVPGRAIEDEVE